MSTQRLTCNEARERMPLYVGADLDPELQAAVRVHLEGCADCARLAGTGMRARRALSEALRANVGPKPDLWTGIRATLRTEGLVHEPVHADVPRRAVPAARARWKWALVPLAAAAAVVFVLRFTGADDGVLPKDSPAPEGPELVMPAPQTVGGTLQRIDPRKVQRLIPLTQPAGQERVLFPGEASPASFGRSPWR
jgi:hypothetical protein